MSLRKRFGQAFRILPRLEYEGPTKADHHGSFRTERSLPSMEVTETWENAVAPPDGMIADRTTVAEDPASMDGVETRPGGGRPTPEPRVLSPEEALRGYDGRPTQEVSGPWRTGERKTDRSGYPPRPLVSRGRRSHITKASKALAEDLDGTWTPDGLTLGGNTDG